MKAFSAKLKHIYGPNLPVSPKMGRGFCKFGTNPSAVPLIPLLESATVWCYLQSSTRSWRWLHEEPKLKTLLVQSGFQELSQDLTYMNYHLSPQTPTLRIPHQSPLFTDPASEPEASPTSLLTSISCKLPSLADSTASAIHFLLLILKASALL